MVVTIHVSIRRFDELVKQQGNYYPVAGYTEVLRNFQEHANAQFVCLDRDGGVKQPSAETESHLMYIAYWRAFPASKPPAVAPLLEFHLFLI